MSRLCNSFPVSRVISCFYLQSSFQHAASELSTAEKTDDNDHERVVEVETPWNPWNEANEAMKFMFMWPRHSMPASPQRN